MRKAIPVLNLYVILEFASSLLLSLIFTVNLLYHVTVVKLNPLQLVLVGTALEASVFLFEVPTGILAGVKSRRLSVIIGYALMGIGFIVEGSFPLFLTVALAQVLWGVGYTFTSGATQAWVADEVGAERAGQAFLRGAQAGQVGTLIAIPISVALGTSALTLPIVLGGVGMLALAGFLALTMPEEGFTPATPVHRTALGAMAQTLADARLLTRRQPALLMLLGVGLFFGLYSEGFDRLWTAHLLQNFTAPWASGIEPVAWFGTIRGVAVVMSLVAIEVARRRVRTQDTHALARALMAIAGLIVTGLLVFGLTGSFWLALIAYWLVGVMRGVRGPLHTTWFNQGIDNPQVRATMFSVSSQVDAIGQIGGGPMLGAIGNLASIRAALVASAMLLTPAVPLYSLATRR